MLKWLLERLLKRRKLGMKCFVVSSRDLFDRKKNPHLRLDVKYILKNKKIVKRAIR